MHGLSGKGDLTKYIQTCACGKPYASKAWFKEILHVNNLNKNMMDYIQFNSFIIENYGIKPFNEINLNCHFFITTVK